MNAMKQSISYQLVMRLTIYLSFVIAMEGH